MNPGMNTLHPYPFEKLAELTSGVALPSLSRIALTIGEPKHQPPAHVLEALSHPSRKWRNTQLSLALWN